MFGRLLRRQVVVAFRRPVQLMNPLLFYAIVIALFPLGLGPAPATLEVFAPGILWIVALLSNMLGADTLFRGDFDDGSLEQLLLAPQPLYFLVFPYLLVHWLVTGLLLAALAPLFGTMLNLPGHAMPILCLALLLGAGVLSCIGAIGGALTVGLRRGGVLIALLVTPFYVPVLIFGVEAVQAAMAGRDPLPFLAILGAMLCLSLALAPLAVATALRISADG